MFKIFVDGDVGVVFNFRVVGLKVVLLVLVLAVLEPFKRVVVAIELLKSENEIVALVMFLSKILVVEPCG